MKYCKGLTYCFILIIRTVFTHIILCILAISMYYNMTCKNSLPHPFNCLDININIRI